MVTRCPPTVRTGTPRRMVAPSTSNRASSTVTASSREAVQAEQRVEVAEPEVPAPRLLAVPEADRPVRDRRLAGRGVDQRRLPLGVLARVTQVVGAQEAIRDVRVTTRRERHQQRQIGEALRVLDESRHLAIGPELLQHHVAHRHRQRAVGAGLRREPVVGERGVIAVVGRHHDDLLALVARLGHEVRVRRAGDRDVRAPHDQVAGVPPVAGLGHVGLVPERLRRRGREVGVPVVEAQHRAAQQGYEPAAGDERHGRHRRQRGEADDPVRPVRGDRVHVRGGDQLRGLVPARAHEPALAALALVGGARLGIGLDRGPGLHRVARARLLRPIALEQAAADQRVLEPQR